MFEWLRRNVYIKINIEFTADPDVLESINGTIETFDIAKFIDPMKEKIQCNLLTNVPRKYKKIINNSPMLQEIIREYINDKYFHLLQQWYMYTITFDIVSKKEYYELLISGEYEEI